MAVAEDENTAAEMPPPAVPEQAHDIEEAPKTVDPAYLRELLFQSRKRTAQCFLTEHFLPPTSVQTW